MDVRKSFYNEVVANWNTSTAHTSTMVLGDFNAKLFHRLHGEDDLLGEFVFPSPFTIDLASSNRELLLEVCVAMSAVVGNTLFENSVEDLVTYYAPGSNPKDAINPKGFSQIDFCLLDPASINFAQNIWTNRNISLASSHFMRKPTLSRPPSQRTTSFNVDAHQCMTALRNSAIARGAEAKALSFRLTGALPRNLLQHL